MAVGVGAVLWAVATLLVTVFLIGLFWRKLANDRVGDVITPPDAGGVQGKVAYWLRENAPLAAPRDPTKPVKPGRVDPESPAGRAMAAILRETMVRDRLDVTDAHARLLERAGPVAGPFLQGRMRTATLAHLRSIYRGPSSLYWLWVLLVTPIRHGRRRLYLDTVTHAVRELRT